MSVELMREGIKISRVLGEDSTQTIVENDIIVPDVKPDISNILLLDGNAFVENAEVLQDKVLVNGQICFKLLYVSDNPEDSVKSINPNVSFSYGLDMPGSKNGMKCNVRCDIEHIEFNLLNSRKVNIKTIMNINAKVTDASDTELVYDLGGLDNIQVLKSKAEVNSYLGSNIADYNVSEILEMPAGKPSIKEILRHDIKLTGKEWKVSESKIIAKGDLNVLTLYLADDEERSIQFIEHEIPFTQFIDLPGLEENARCDVDYQVTGSQFTLEEDNDGELRVLSAEIALKLTAEGYCKKTVELVDDAYSPRMRLDIEKKPFKMREIAAESKSQVTIKDSIQVQGEGPEIAEVFNILCRPILTDCNVLDDKVVIEGVVSNNVLYLANNAEEPVYCYKQEIPFKHSIDIKGIRMDMECEVDLDIEHYNYSMISASEVEVRLVIGVNSKVIDQAVLPVITKVVEIPVDDKRLISQPSITIYFTQPGDNLWKIAKKYYTTMDDIKAVNNLAGSEAIGVGQQIIIPRKAV